MEEHEPASVFEKDRALRAQTPKLTYAISFIAGGAAVFFISALDSFIGIILALVAGERILVQMALSDRATYLIAMTAFAIAGILGGMLNWTWPGLGSHMNLILVLIPAALWGYKYRKALNSNTSQS